MICKLDNNNWCERHKVHHEGLYKHWALSNTAMGEQYRLMWDKHIGIIKQLSPVINTKQFAPKKGGCGCGKKPELKKDVE